MQKKIAHITDTHLGDKTALDNNINPEKNLISILEALSAEAIDELVFTGDIGEEETYNWFFKTLDQYKPGFKIVLGNHDNFKEVARYYNMPTAEEKGELYYCCEDEFCKYIFMDSSSAVVSLAQLKWLSAEVTTTKRIIVFIHHPIIEIATGIDTNYPLHNREEVAQILQQSKHEVTVFCGHYHMPDKRSMGKIKQYITPAVSFQVKKFSPILEIKAGSFGYRIISLTEFGINCELVIDATP